MALLVDVVVAEPIKPGEIAISFGIFSNIVGFFTDSNLLGPIFDMPVTMVNGSGQDFNKKRLRYLHSADRPKQIQTTCRIPPTGDEAS